jgi:hypothetical protein
MARRWLTALWAALGYVALGWGVSLDDGTGIPQSDVDGQATGTALARFE